MIINIKKKNLATTERPDEYKGSIALDHHTFDNMLDNLLKKHIDSSLLDQYRFVGAKVDLGDSTSMFEDGDGLINVKFILSEKNKNFFFVEKEINFIDFFLCFTSVVFQFSEKYLFEDDTIDWDNIQKIE